MAASFSRNNWQRPLFTVGSVVLVVAALSLARAVLIPVVLAVLLTFVLNPVVGALQRLGLGRIPSVIGVVLLAFCLLGAIGSGVVVQLKNLATDLPQHEHEIDEKIEMIRAAGRGSWFVDSYDTIMDIVRKVQGTQTAPATRVEPVPVRIETSPFPLLQSVAGSAMEVLLSAGMTIVLLIFMLIEREELGKRLMRLWGATSMKSMTRAFDDAVRRISRFLLVQLAINAAFGTALAMGLWIIGVPYATLLGFLAGTLRYIPYIGIWIGALLPITLAIAILPGWTPPLLVLGLFGFLELMTYNIVEPWLFGHSVGVSATALLIAAAFWAWLWGPIGLVIATPLTACLAVLGKYFRDLEFFSILLGGERVPEPHVTYYQRLFARDQDEATDLVEEFVQTHSALEVYDRVLVPALSLGRESRQRGESTAEEERFLLQVMHETVDLVLPNQQAQLDRSGEESAQGPEKSAASRVLVFGCPARDEMDELALTMLRQLVDPCTCRFEVISHKKLTAEVISHVQQQRPAAVCVASVPPTGLAHTRYLCKRLRAQFPDLKILVGCWGFEDNLERTRQRLVEAGADQAGFSLLETRAQIAAFIQVQAHRKEEKPAPNPSATVPVSGRSYSRAR